MRRPSLALPCARGCLRAPRASPRASGPLLPHRLSSHQWLSPFFPLLGLQRCPTFRRAPLALLTLCFLVSRLRGSAAWLCMCLAPPCRRPPPSTQAPQMVPRCAPPSLLSFVAVAPSSPPVAACARARLGRPCLRPAGLPALQHAPRLPLFLLRFTHPGALRFRPLRCALRRRHPGSPAPVCARGHAGPPRAVHAAPGLAAAAAFPLPCSAGARPPGFPP